jgi:hypothetical protein
MKTVFSAPRRSHLLLFVVTALLLIAPTSYANVRTEPSDLPGYARLSYEDLFHTDEWAVIVFYRPPDCVPDDFNLLEFFDFNAFDCGPATTDGFYIWDGEPWISNPVQVMLQGLGDVPVWFVAWPDLQAAIADTMLTMSELEALSPRLIGSASFYNETLHPTGAAVKPMINFVAHGTLVDGRSFQVHVKWTENTDPQVRIEFR